MPVLASTRERLTICLAVAAVWSFGYLGIGAWNAGRPASVLPWDPIHAFPFASVFVIPYLSAYVLPLLAIAFLRERKALRAFAAVVVVTILASALCFAFWSLTIDRPDIGAASLSDRALAALYAADHPVNLFPSLHVSLSFLFAAAVGYARPRWRGWALAWAALIAVSTLFTRQHYLVDVLGGVVLAWVGWRAFLRLAK